MCEAHVVDETLAGTASVVETARMISARTHAHPRWPEACLPANIYSSISAGLAGVSLMHMYRGRVWLVLCPRQHATISIRTCKFRAGRRTHVRVGESGSREFRGRASGVGGATRPISRARKRLDTVLRPRVSRKWNASRGSRIRINGTAKAARSDFCGTRRVRDSNRSQNIPRGARRER